ncbi:MAG: putative NADPH-quinone reductase (modulator of drug activity B) [Pelagibacterales bacterium]|jgi:putative NADPH-quinone reductase|nr:putative NADPH-quinone reductase (modulator of drug activity B) [Pelagibacterales bacterium]
MSKKIFIAYGHYNTKTSFNALVRDTFIKEAKKCGHEIDLVNLHEEKPIKFFDGTPPDDQILDYRKRLEAADVMFLISPCYNLRASAILENWIDLVLAPKWFFTFKAFVKGYNYGYPVPGALKNKLAIVSLTYGGPFFSIALWFQNLPVRRIKAGILRLGGMKIKYLRFYEVLPNMPENRLNTNLEKIRETVRQL